MGNNPYVLIGGALLIYWWISRKNILKANPNANTSVSSYSFNGEISYTAKKYGVPKKLVQDARKMSKVDLATMIIDNQKMLNKTKMSNDERKHVLRMVDYLEVELDKKM
jgi:hypothetical protein